MDLVLSKKDTRKMKVEAVYPGDMLEKTELIFIAEFKVFPNKEWKEMIKEEPVEKVIKKGLVGIEDFKDLAGTGHPYSEALVDGMLNHAWLVNGLFNAQTAIQGGVTQSDWYKAVRRKNL